MALFVAPPRVTNPQARALAPEGPLTEALHAVYGPTIAIRGTVSGLCQSRLDIPHGGSGTEGVGGSPVKHFYLLNERAREWLGSERRCDDAVYAACMRAVSDYSQMHGLTVWRAKDVPINPLRYPELFVWPCFGRPTHQVPTIYERWRERVTLPESYSDAVFKWSRANRFSLTKHEAGQCEHEASRRVKLLCASLRPIMAASMFNYNSPDATLRFFEQMFQLQEKLGDGIPVPCRVAQASAEEVAELHKDREAYIARFEPYERINSAYNLYVDTFYEAAGRRLFEKLCRFVYRHGTPAKGI